MDKIAVISLMILSPFALYFGFRWRNASWKKWVEAWLEKEGLQGEVIPAFMPPLRLWLNNRKGDFWCQVKFEDGTQRWARARRGLFGQGAVELLD